ncbi:MAG TPA: carboxypeptidase-like regulatory domain-containing protein [Acidobacteriaceae bacterium]
MPRGRALAPASPLLALALLSVPAIGMAQVAPAVLSALELPDAPMPASPSAEAPPTLVTLAEPSHAVPGGLAAGLNGTEAAPVPGPGPAGGASGTNMSGTMSGTAMDIAGDVLAGATVTLANTLSGSKRTTLSDGTGFFSFPAVEVGTYEVTITAAGFAGWTETSIPMRPAADLYLPHIVLQVASATTEVKVVFSQYELAEAQVKVEEKQRVLGIVPNFYTSYVWHAAPLTPGQKFRLAWRSSIDPFSFIGSGVAAGIEQARNTFSGYGQGAQGYGKRYGAVYADDFIGNFIGGAILPTVLRQDPRYFYKGTGSIRARALYAMSTVFIARGDNGKWQPNYSGVLGNLAAAGFSNLYYPASDRDGAGVTIDNALIGTVSGAISALIQEFLLKHITPSAAGPKP